MRNELPPILNGQLKGRLAVNMPRTLRFEMENDIILLARPDDYIEQQDGINPIDHKTASKAPTDVHPAYTLQMSTYSFILKEMGFKSSKGYLIYYHPLDCVLHDGMLLVCSVIEVNMENQDDIKQLISRAVDVLNGPIPERGENCQYCTWIEQVQRGSQEGVYDR